MIFWLPKAKNLKKKVTKGVLFFFIFFCGLSSFSQQFSKVIQGKIVSPQKDVTGITIQNISTTRATITDIQGNFSIRATVGDTLVFSAVQFKRKVLPVTTALFQSSFVQIPMDEFVNELQEVTVQPFGLSGDIEKDLTGLQLEKDVSAEALGLPNAHQNIPTQSERKLQQATFGKFNVGMILSPPLDPIINMITGRTKMLKNRVRVDKTYQQTQNVQKRYADSIFQTDLKIPKLKIDDFMYFCEVDDTFQELVALGDELRLWDYLLQRSAIYRKNNGLD